MKRVIKMNIKLILYVIILPLAIYALDSVKINNIFKNNKIFAARVLYIMVAICMTYLVVNFIYDFFLVSKIY